MAKRNQDRPLVATVKALFNRVPPPLPREEQQPSHFDRKEPDRAEERRKKPVAIPRPHIPTAFYTGEPESRASVKDLARQQFERNNASPDEKAKQAIEQRFQTERGRATAYLALATADAERDRNRQQFEDRKQELKDELKFLVSFTHMPVPPEAAAHNNRNFRVNEENFKLRNEAVEHRYEKMLIEADAVDLAERPKLLQIGYSFEPTEHFQRATEPGREWLAQFDQPEAPTQPAEPDRDTAWIKEFNAKWHEPQRPDLGIDL